MADSVGWGTTSKVVLWSSVAFLVLYIVMSGFYWRYYTNAKTVDPNGDVVDLWASFPLFTFIWSFVILGFVLYLLWRAHTTKVILETAGGFIAGAGAYLSQGYTGASSYLSQGYAERFGENRESLQRAKILRNKAREIEVIRENIEKLKRQSKTSVEKINKEIAAINKEFDQKKARYAQIDISIQDYNNFLVLNEGSPSTDVDVASTKINILSEIAKLTSEKALIEARAEELTRRSNVLLFNRDRILKETNDAIIRSSGRINGIMSN